MWTSRVERTISCGIRVAPVAFILHRIHEKTSSIENFCIDLKVQCEMMIVLVHEGRTCYG